MVHGKIQPKEQEELPQIKDPQTYPKDENVIEFIKTRTEGGSIRHDITHWKTNSNPILMEHSEEFIRRTIEKNNKQMRVGSHRYYLVLKRVLKIYIKLLIKIMLDVMIRGDKFIFFFHAFTAHICDMPVKKQMGRTKYKYYRKLGGMFPVIRVAVDPRVANKTKHRYKVWHTAMAIDAYYGEDLSKIIGYKVVKENMKYSSEWRAFIKFNK